MQEHPFDEYQFYNVHDRFGLAVQRDAVATEIAREQWQFFEVPNVNPTLTINSSGDARRLVGVGNGVRTVDDASFSEGSIYIPKYRTGIANTSRGWVFDSSRETGRLAAPLLDYLLLERGLALLHSAAVGYGGKGYLITGWGGVGKTSSLAHLLEQGDFSFLADDWVFADVDGWLRCFPKPMYIYSYHSNLYPHLFESPPKPIMPQRFARQVAALRKTVRPTFERFPRLERHARKWSPEHMKVMPSRALPDVIIENQLQAGGVVFLQRGAVSSPVMEPLGEGVLARRLVGIMNTEFSVSAREVFAIAAGTGLVSLSDWIQWRTSIVASLVGRVPVVEVTVPLNYQAEAVGPIVEEAIRGLAM